MKKYYFVAAIILLFMALPSLEAQAKKRLAILPFSGGEAQDGETISVLLSNQKALLDVFTIQPRNSTIDRIMGEQQFQRQSGLINSDAISEIGKLNTADLVVSGYIAKLSNTNLILISIIDVTEIQQIAGVYQTYRSIEEIRGLLPGLSERLAAASKKGHEDLPGLAVPSFSVPANVNANDAMVLAQVLATEIVNMGKYAVFPRTSSVDDVLKEAQFQRSGQTADSKALGTSRSIDFILASSVMGLGKMNLFASQILNIEGGNAIVGTDREYQDIADGLNKNLMREIAGELTGGEAKASASTASESASVQKPVKEKKQKEERSGGTGNAFGYGMLNIALGLGSYLQGDVGGGVVVTAGYAISVGLIVWELAGLTYDDDLAGIPGTVGLGVAGATLVFGFIKPALYSKSPKVASIMDRVNIVAVSDDQHMNSLGITYTHHY